MAQAQPIRVVVVDDVASTLEDVTRLISFDRDIDVVGTARNGLEAVELTRALKPDVVLMDVNMPEMDGVEAASAISKDMPGIVIVMMSVQSDSEYLRSAMSAGARDYLVKPFGPDDATATIKRAYKLEVERAKRTSAAGDAKGRVITIFSAKGGVGKTTLAVNMAACIAGSGQRVALMDLDLQFGDVAMMLDMVPRRSLVDVALAGDEVECSTVTACLDSYHGPRLQGPLRMLAAPARPEQAEYVKPMHVEGAIRAMREINPITIVDTSHNLDDITLSVLDASDEIIVVTTLELPTIKNVRLALELMDSLGYKRDSIHLVINRWDAEGNVMAREAEKALGMKVSARIPREERIALTAANRGMPFVLSAPKSEMSSSIRSIANSLCPIPNLEPSKEEPIKERLNVHSFIPGVRRAKPARG